MKKMNQIAKWIWRGKSIIRSFLNERLSHETLVGSTIDLGGGKGEGYISFVQRNNCTFQTFDLHHGDKVDFETEQLPAKTDSYDTILFLNVLEHIFNHRHILQEVVRVSKPGGKVIGFVPFLMWFHPDHEDHFRYTHQSLERLFSELPVTYNIEPIESGPFIASLHMTLLLWPRPIRVVLFYGAYLLDRLVDRARKRSIPKYVLGYYFQLEKTLDTPQVSAPKVV